jgi:hypothetical protein
MRKDLRPLPFFQEALTLAKFEPGTYTSSIIRRAGR